LRLRGIREREVDAGGKGDISGIKWMISAVTVSDSGVGAMKIPTSKLRARNPGGFSVL